MTNTIDQIQNTKYKTLNTHYFLFSLLIGLLGYLCIGLFPANAFAADFALGVYPPILQIQATAPTIISKDITVVNASQDTENVSVTLRPFTASGTNNGQVLYLPVGTKMLPDKDIFQKVQILDGDTPISSLSLAPKQKKTLTLRIGLPKDEPGADYYFSVLFVSTDSVNQDANGSHITAGIAANILLSIAPKDETTGLLNEFTTPWFAQTAPIPFTVSITNTSRHFITPTGQILIRNMFGQLVGKVDLLSVNVLGNSTRFLTSKENAVDNNHPVALWNKNVLFGPYRANIIVSLSPEGPLFTKTIYFFVMPWEYLLGFFLAVVILLIVIERVRHKMTHL
ncbi:MAG TPA: hypothetical protein VLB73_03715 [Patescibacteria group bacterium]|nr:hypothetical protein [Patescibacteria group bacterium]